jgi:thiol-disulfide isomerase/thioredoxin
VVLAFVTRVGGMVVAPPSTLSALRQGKKGGLADLVILLALQLVAVHLEHVVRAVWLMVKVSYTPGVSMLLNTLAQSVLYPVVGVFLGTVVVSFAARGKPGRGAAVDLVSLCALPAISLDLALTLISALSGYRPDAPAVMVATAVGALWFFTLVGLSIRLLRRPEEEEGARGDVGRSAPARRGAAPLPSARVAGLGVMAILAALFLLNLVWIVRNCDQLRPVVSGARAPDFELPRHGGGRERLSKHRGEVVLLSFWASWCGPCIKEMPHLVDLERRHRERGFRVLAINIEGNPKKIDETRATVPAARKLTTLLDPDGVAARRYGVQTLPHLVVVGRDGAAAFVHVGGKHFERVVKAVEKAVENPAE